MSGRESRYKTKYFGLGGGFGMVDMILGGVVLESRRNAVRMSRYEAFLIWLGYTRIKPSCTSGGIVPFPLDRFFFLGA